MALRHFLKDNGFKTDTSGGGDVSIKPQSNATSLDQLKQGQIDGAWVPEPWATRLVLDGKGKVLVDEGTLWPGGKFLTTTLIVRTAFLKDHPEVVRNLLKGHVEATDFVNQHSAEAQQIANTSIGQITGKPLTAPVITAAWKNLTFTWDPLASTLRKEASDAEAAGLLQNVNLNGIVDVGPLNTVLTADGKGTVHA